MKKPAPWKKTAPTPGNLGGAAKRAGRYAPTPGNLGKAQKKIQSATPKPLRPVTPGSDPLIERGQRMGLVERAAPGIGYARLLQNRGYRSGPSTRTDGKKPGDIARQRNPLWVKRMEAKRFAKVVNKKP